MNNIYIYIFIPGYGNQIQCCTGVTTSVHSIFKVKTAPTIARFGKYFHEHVCLYCSYSTANQYFKLLQHRIFSLATKWSLRGSGAYNSFTTPESKHPQFLTKNKFAQPNLRPHIRIPRTPQILWLHRYWCHLQLMNVHRLLSIQWIGAAASFFTAGPAQLQVRWRETGV
jgi:hypothetical protein